MYVNVNKIGDVDDFTFTKILFALVGYKNLPAIEMNCLVLYHVHDKKGPLRSSFERIRRAFYYAFNALCWNS